MVKFCCEKGNYTFLFMENRVANTCEVFIRPTSCLAASLAEFDLFIHELYRFACLTQKFLSTCETALGDQQS